MPRSNVAKMPEPEPEFDLAELVREHVRERKSPDPYEVAGAVIDEIPDDELYGVVELLLPDYVRERIDAERRSAQRRKRSKKGKNTESVKWEQTEDGDWDEIFWTSVSVPGIGRKWLGECTQDDIAGIIADYEDLAASNQAMADSYTEILSLMQSNEAEEVSELAAELVVSAFTGEEEEDDEEEEDAA